MPQAQGTVNIARPIETVFAYLADGEKCPEWRPGVLDIKRLNGDGGVGTRYVQGVGGLMGRRIPADYEIAAFERNRAIEFQTVAGPVRPHGRYELAPADGGTRLTFSLDAPLSGIKGLLMARAVQRTMEAEVGALERLKGVLEASA
jgi:uncharacterized protein YndB with AHSA1/START domain